MTFANTKLHEWNIYITIRKINIRNSIKFCSILFVKTLFDTSLYLPSAFHLDIKCKNHIEIFFHTKNIFSHILDILTLPNEIIETKKWKPKTLFSPRIYKWTKYQIQIVLFSLNYYNNWNNLNYLLQLWFDWIGGFDPTGGCN